MHEDVQDLHENAPEASMQFLMQGLDAAQVSGTCA